MFENSFFLVLSVPMTVCSYERAFLGYWIWGEYIQNSVWFAIQIFFSRRIWSRTMTTPHAVSEAHGRQSVPWHCHQSSQPGTLAFGLGLPLIPAPRAGNKMGLSIIYLFPLQGPWYFLRRVRDNRSFLEPPEIPTWCGTQSMNPPNCSF